MAIHPSGHVYASRMLYMFSGLLSLLLDVALISGQRTEGLLRPEEAIKNGTEQTKFHNANHISGNMTGNVTSEDQENFQDQEKIHHYHRCNETLLYEYGYLCLFEFDLRMDMLGDENWCDWEQVLSNYNGLTHCLEKITTYAKCYYPNAAVQEMFVEAHKKYFSSCSTKEDNLPDAPAKVVLVLTLLPVSVIPILVYIVIRKSSAID
ncbi:receptor activity-modifying protein 1 isoform 2-T2 [Clarias gariepinus]|uniref:receptor activity-modifying protein 1-like isoform X2 n=1 Tax=Clarias gariepinus TaxID=13013 RepID=UPI00234D8FEF|nr:receptor activity-modifying protein 1-like isoform X2 [Clarias gariepinus]